MVHIVIENLLSTCKNRPLYEALWFLAFTKNSRPENLENESVSGICNELIARIREEDVDARSFIISTNLAFGTVRLYKAQIDKLYEQAKFALQSCTTTFNHMDWFTQMTQVTSTPIIRGKTPKKPLKPTQASAKKKNVKKPAIEPPLIMDDFDMIESIYNIPDVEEEDVSMTPVPKGRKRESNKYDTGIDPTMASDVHTITMREPSSLLTSGYNTMLNDEYEDGFGDKMGNEFQNILKDAENTVLSQDDLIQTTSNLLSTIKNRKRKGTADENTEIKKRRLTYMNYDESISVLRNANADQQVPDIDIYQPEHPLPMDQASTFYESINVTEATVRNFNAVDNIQSMMQSTMHFEAMDIEEPSIPMTTFNEPTIPNTTFNESTTLKNNADTLMENLTLNEATILGNDDVTMVPDIPSNPIVQDVDMNKPENPPPQESEFLLDDIPVVVKQKRVRKSRNLITDKCTILPVETVKKGIQNYKEKLVGIPPFFDFQRRMHFLKSCSDVLFSTGSFRLKKSPLHHLYARNMKKIPEKFLKKQMKENKVVKETYAPEIKNLRRSARSAKVRKNLKEKGLNDMEEEQEDILMPQMFDTKDVEMKDISPVVEHFSPGQENVPPEIENVSPEMNSVKRVTRSNRSKNILKELNNIDVEMAEFDIPEIPHYVAIEKDQRMDDIELPPALDYENMKINKMNVNDNQDGTERIDRKNIVLKKLAKFWKRSDKSITVDKLCNGMIRCEAAGTFFELLLLAKRCVVELIQIADSLEISNILCNISTAQLSKELYN